MNRQDLRYKGEFTCHNSLSHKLYNARNPISLKSYAAKIAQVIAFVILLRTLHII